MDFVISKVAMSVCALLVAGVLGGAMSPVLELDHGVDLRHILGTLDRLFIGLASVCGPCAAKFVVPSLPDGGVVRLSIEHDLLSASSANAQAFERPSIPVHTWYASASGLNGTLVRELDGAAQACIALTGDCLAISLESRVLDGDSVLMMFVRQGDESQRN